MKTSIKFAALGVVSLGFSLGLAGCSDNNDKAILKNAEGGTGVAGKPAAGVATSSADAAKQQKAQDPMQSDSYKKAMQNK